MKQTFLKFTLIITMIIAGTGISDAQLRYGFNFGGSFAAARLSDAPGISLGNRSGFRGGLTLEYQLPTSGIAFDGSILYHRYNTRLRDNNSGSLTAFGRNFIDVPFSVKYKFWISAVSNLVAPFIYTGPSLMFNVDSAKDAPLKQKRFQPGWNVGVGFDAVNFLQLQAGYRFGFGNAIHRFNAFPDAELNTSGWHVSAILLFDF